MLAGRMKLNNFLALVMVGAAAVASGAAVWMSGDEGSSSPAVVSHEVEVNTAVPIRPMPVARLDPQGVAKKTSSSAPVVKESPAVRIDKKMRTFIGKDLGSSKKKDVTSGEAFKINVYQDEGHTTANRAKVDLDRDDKWDEKWTFGDDLTRKLAPNDDEVYTVEQIWAEGAWQTR